MTQPPYVTVTPLHSFTREEGGHPRSSMYEGSDGKLYGSLWQCGPNGGGDAEHSCSSNFYFDTPEQKLHCPGSLYRLSHAGVFELVHGFTRLDNTARNTDGYQPCGPLAPGFSDTLIAPTTKGGHGYPGVASGGQGVLVSFRPNDIAGSFTTLKQFGELKQFADGSTPFSPPAQHPVDCNLYGFASAGGPSGSGVIYRITAAGQVSTVYTFPPKTTKEGPGIKPWGGPAISPDGIIYGENYFGAAYGLGCVFAFNPATNAMRVVHAFDSDVWTGNRDNTAIQGLLMGPDGWVYGSRQFGGVNGSGVVFRINRVTDEYQLLHEFGPCVSTSVPRFANADGALPLGTPIWGRDGNIYGTVSSGGDYGQGGIYQIRPDGSQYVLLHSFDTTMIHPHGGIVQSTGGSFYGTTFSGGDQGFGAAYRMDAPLTIPAVVDASGNTLVESAPIRCGCIPGSTVDASNGEVSINGGPWSSSLTVRPGDAVRVRGIASPTPGGRTLVRLKWGGGISGSFSISTRR